jgi:gas vesicle protein
MEESNNTTKIIGALVLGAAIGATIGILFAPDKGSVTRKKISSKGDELSDVLKEKFNAFMNDAKKELEEVKERTNTLLENSLEKIKETEKEL